MITTWEDEKVEVKEKNGIKSLISKRYFLKGEQIFFVEGEEIKIPNRYSVQVSDSIHVNVKEPVMYINHKCDGNIQLIERAFYALKQIQVGEEITFNYNNTERVLAEEFKCFRCGQLVKGNKSKTEFPCLKFN